LTDWARYRLKKVAQLWGQRHLACRGTVVNEDEFGINNILRCRSKEQRRVTDTGRRSAGGRGKKRNPKKKQPRSDGLTYRQTKHYLPGVKWEQRVGRQKVGSSVLTPPGSFCKNDPGITGVATRPIRGGSPKRIRPTCEYLFSARCRGGKPSQK